MGGNIFRIRKPTIFPKTGIVNVTISGAQRSNLLHKKYFALVLPRERRSKQKFWKFAVFVGSISFIQCLCVNFKLMATAVLVVERLVYVTMSDTFGPEFYSKTVNRTIRGSAVATGFIQLMSSWQPYRFLFWKGIHKCF